MFVPANKHDEAISIAKRAAESVVVGNPVDKSTTMGPLVSQLQWNKVQDLIQQAIDEGCDLVYGGLGTPDNLKDGYFVKPTIFANVNNKSTIAQQEIFGPVLSIIPFNSVNHAIEIANDSLYGLCGYVWGEPQEAVFIASKMRTGMILLNGNEGDYTAPFGGYKQSGNGREFGHYGFEEFLETKAIMGVG